MGIESLSSFIDFIRNFKKKYKKENIENIGHLKAVGTTSSNSHDREIN